MPGLGLACFRPSCSGVEVALESIKPGEAFVAMASVRTMTCIPSVPQKLGVVPKCHVAFNTDKWPEVLNPAVHFLNGRGFIGFIGFNYSVVISDPDDIGEDAHVEGDAHAGAIAVLAEEGVDLKVLLRKQMLWPLKAGSEKKKPSLTCRRKDPPSHCR